MANLIVGRKDSSVDQRLYDAVKANLIDFFIRNSDIYQLYYRGFFRILVDHDEHSVKYEPAGGEVLNKDLLQKHQSMLLEQLAAIIRTAKQGSIIHQTYNESGDHAFHTPDIPS